MWINKKKYEKLECDAKDNEYDAKMFRDLVKYIKSQNILLSQWKEIFEYVPIESQIKKYQDKYYKVINNCNKNGNSNEFIEFMLQMINEVLEELLETIDKEISHISIYVSKLLDIMDYNIPMSSNEIMDKLGIKSKETLRANYIDPALENGLIKMTLPDKPTSKNQMYYKI